MYVRHGAHVSTNEGPGKKPRHHRMEELHGRQNIQRIFGHPKPPLRAGESQNQWQTVDKTIHQQNTPHNTQSVDIQELFTARQTERMVEEEGVKRRDDQD